MNDDSIIRIFCDAGDFCSRFERYCKSRLLPADTGRAWLPRSRLTLSEVMTIVILFHLSGYRCFKWYYREYVCERLSGYFPRLVSCNRFVKLTRKTLRDRGYISRKLFERCTGGDKTGNSAEKEYEEQANGKSKRRLPRTHH
jgi:hypothetical protein